MNTVNFDTELPCFPIPLTTFWLQFYIKIKYLSYGQRLALAA